MFDLFGEIHLFRGEPPPNPDKPLLRKPAYRGGKVYKMAPRATPKINRRRELKTRKAALRKWKRAAGISGRLSSSEHSMFVTLWNKSQAETKNA